MRKQLLSLLILFACILSRAQTVKIFVDQYEWPDRAAREEFVRITMPFGGSDILRVEGDSSGLRKAGEWRIDIVCTDFPATASLDRLNAERLDKVLHLFPSIDRKKIGRVNILRQTNGAERDKALTLFHGVVIWYRLVQSKELMKEDLVKLEKLLEPVAPVIPDTVSRINAGRSIPGFEEEKPASADTKPLAKSISKELLPADRDTFRKRVYIGAKSGSFPDLREREPSFEPADSLAIMSPKKAFEQGIIDEFTYNDFRTYPLMTIYFGPGLDAKASLGIDELDSVAVVKDSLAPGGYSLKPNFKLPDSTVFRIFTRNRWRNVMVVGDVTGSMYPYTAQLLLWLKLHSLDSFTTKFAFFNDGDNKPDDAKVIGNTGGIYPKICRSFDEAKELVKSTMLKGGGGDAPENDIEALLLTERLFPENDFQVLIADNWAPIKDKSLIRRLTKPVRVVLCGGEYGVNVDYLNLARKTRGSLHLVEEDINNLAALHEGETIRIGRLSFKIVDGEFRETTGSEDSLRL